MLCENCGEKTAEFDYIQMEKNKKTILHLCLDCARKKGFQNLLPSSNLIVGNILAGFLKEGEAKSTSPLPKLKCSGCGLSYGEFRRHGRLGCSRCYDAFFDNLKDLLRRIHGSNDHVGKAPHSSQKRFQIRRELSRLHREMRRVVEREEFEKAAVLRDQIRKLEQIGTEKINPGGKP